MFTPKVGNNIQGMVSDIIQKKKKNQTKIINFKKRVNAISIVTRLVIVIVFYYSVQFCDLPGWCTVILMTERALLMHKTVYHPRIRAKLKSAQEGNTVKRQCTPAHRAQGPKNAARRSTTSTDRFFFLFVFFKDPNCIFL